MSKIFQIFIIAFIATCNPVFSTAQIADDIWYKGKKYPLFTNPLESYFNENNPRPKKMIKIGPIGTNCWRGYKAVWKIKNNTLYLKSIRGCYGFTWKRLRSIFGDKCKWGKVKADWYTGELRLQKGKMFHYVHMGYMSKYEKEIIISVENGIVTNVNEIENKPRTIPEGYKIIEEHGFLFYLPQTIYPCATPDTSDSVIVLNPKREYCFNDTNQNTKIHGRVWFDKKRSDFSKRPKLAETLIDSCGKTTFPKIEFENIKKNQLMTDHFYYMDSFSLEDSTFIRAFLILNLHTRAVAYLTIRGKERNQSEKTADTIFLNPRIMEFSY